MDKKSGLIFIFAFILIIPIGIIISNSPKEEKLTSNEVVWNNLRSEKEGECEVRDAKEGQYIYDLKEYPDLFQSNFENYLVVSSLRNNIASDFSVDVLNCDYEIVFTIYKYTSLDLHPTREGLILFDGFVGPDCTERVRGYIDIENNETVLLPKSEFLEVTYADNIPTLRWGRDGNTIISSYVNENNVLEVKVFDLEAEFKRTVELRYDKPFIVGCGASCVSPAVYLEDNKFYLAIRSVDMDLGFTTLVYDLEGIRLDESESNGLNDNVKENYEQDCTNVEYSEGGTSVFCRYFLTNHS